MPLHSWMYLTAVTTPLKKNKTKGLRAMTMKERLAVHRQIEAENERKLKEWKERNYESDGSCLVRSKVS